MKDPHNVIIAPYITEKSAAMSYGDEASALRRLQKEAKGAKGKKADIRVTEDDLVRKYTFLVAKDANKIEIKQALEAIYNAGKKKKDEQIVVENVRTITIKGKRKRSRTNYRAGGYTPDRKKAIVTLGKGQVLEDFGV